MPIHSSYELLSSAVKLNQSAAELDQVNVRFNLELLNGCEYDCSGCYVNRNVKSSSDDLRIVSEVVADFRNKGFAFDEVILGPTDFFGARNTEIIITDPLFYSMFTSDTVLTVLTTMQGEPDHMLHLIDCINQNFPSDMEMEFLIAVNVAKLRNRDIVYLDKLHRNIALLDQLNLQADYALQMNIEAFEKMDEYNLVELSKFVRDEFDTILEFNPSFLRVGKTSIVQPIFDRWNDQIRKQVTAETRDDITLTVSNVSHADSSELTFNYLKGSFYICPFIYENVFDKKTAFLIPKAGERYTVEDFSNHRAWVEAEQSHYVSQTEDCAACPYLASCISKQVLYYMKQYDLKRCILSKETMALYSGTM